MKNSGKNNLTSILFISIFIVPLIICIISIHESGTDRDFGFVLFVLMIIAVIFGFAYYIKSQKTIESDKFQIRKSMVKNKLNNINSYMAKEPDFSPSEFKEKVANLYIRLQNCIEDKNVEELTPYLTEDMINSLKDIIADLKQKGQTNYIERVAVLGTDLVGWKNVNGSDIMFIRMNTRAVDYIKQDGTDKVISGSPTAEKFSTHEWQLVRSSDAKSSGHSGITSQTCPKCGAQIDINRSALCPYCSSVLDTDDFGWKICSMSTD